MAHVLLLPFGSAGDVFPFIWLGKRLRTRGHRVTMITACPFADHARAAGLDFVPLGTAEDFEALVRDPRIWKLGAGTKLVFEFAAASVGRYLEAIAQARPADLMLAPMTVFAARMAREQLGIPLVTVHLQPTAMLSAHEMPLLHPALRWLRRMPVWFKRAVLALPNPVDLIALPEVRRICKTHGVTPPRSLLRDWWNSPDGVLALFPEWFGRPQPDWPPNLLQWTFPLEDLAAEHPLPIRLQEFLAGGGRPIVFTPGSANVQAGRFFEAAAAAVNQLGCRAVFVTGKPEQVPPGLPENFITVAYAPFSSLLAHASVFVHHGGIGTMAHGFAAGVPQLIMPMAHDQPDNADRLVQLGAGLALSVKHFTPPRVAEQLQRLLDDPAFAQAARICAQGSGAETRTDELMRWIEERAGASHHTELLRQLPHLRQLPRLGGARARQKPPPKAQRRRPGRPLR